MERMSCCKATVVAVSLREMFLVAVVVGSVASDQAGVNLFRHHHHKRHHKNHHTRVNHAHQRPVQSILALKSKYDTDGVSMDSMWQYQGLHDIKDWEKDLINDDDDKLAETMRKYAKNAKVNGSLVVPTPQSNSEFREDYPKDTEGPLERAQEVKDNPQLNKTASTTNETSVQLEPNQTDQGKMRLQVQAAKKAVELLKKELEDARARAEQAHANVRSNESAQHEQNESIAQAQGELDIAAASLSKCREEEGKLDLDVLLTQQARKALITRLGMLDRQLATTEMKVQKANGTIVAKEKEIKEVKEQLEVATKELQDFQKDQEDAEAKLQNATDALVKRNQTLTTAIAAANHTFAERLEEAKKQPQESAV